MKQRIFNRGLFITLVGLFMALTGTALAQERQGHTLSMTGLAPGQTLRLNVTNNQPRTKPSILARIVVRNAKGIVLAQTDDAIVPAGESRPFNFNLDELKPAGDPGVSLGFELQIAAQEGNQTQANQALQLSADLIEHITGKRFIIFVPTAMSDPPPCFSHCTHLFCLVYCLRPFTIYVVPTPSN